MIEEKIKLPKYKLGQYVVYRHNDGDCNNAIYSNHYGLITQIVEQSRGCWFYIIQDKINNNSTNSVDEYDIISS
jgi:hypothetical protein